MTTIVFRDGVFAADSMIAYGTYTNGERAKITRCHFYHVALAGLAWLRIPLERWALEGCPEDAVPAELLEHEADFDSLLVNEEGQCFTFCKGYLLPIPSGYIAIGSGSQLALGAMAHGASADEAVAAAMRHDKNTGGSVQSVSFPLN